jgi:Kae1-associated kinase Bud32
MTILGQGAEALVKRDGDVVHKQRIPKTYRHPELDLKLRVARTNKERKVLLRAKELSISVPEVLPNSAENTTLTLSYCAGPRLRDVLISEPIRTAEMHEVGCAVARLHASGIIHGDLTTSNVIAGPSGIVLIDFGLAQFTKKIEDFAVDLHVLEETLESTHPSHYKQLFAAFLSGYRDFENSDEVLTRLDTVRSRGRNK